jgi:signal transduction histidine kinase
MSSVADNDPRNDPESWSSTVLLVGRFLTVLRLVTIGCLVAILGAMAEAGIVTSRPWEDNLVGGALLAYAVVALLLVGILQFVRDHPIWVVELGLVLDGVVLTFVALNTTDVLALFLLLPIMAVGIMRGLATALVALAAGIFAFVLHVFLVPEVLGRLQGFAGWPIQVQMLTLGLFLVLLLLWVSVMAGSSAALVRQHARLASQKAEQATERYRLALQRAKGVYHVTYTLSATLNYESVLRAIFEEFVRVLPFDVGMVLLIEPGSNMLYVSGSYGLNKEELDCKIDGRTGLLGRAAASGQAVIVNNLKAETDVVSAWPRLATFSSAMYIPLRSRFELYGVIVVAIREGHYDQDQLELMVALGNNAIIALQNAQLYQTLREERDRLISKEDEVRRQLARDLHDGPAQVLAQIAMQVDFIKKLLERAPERVPRELDELADKARRANQDVRTLLFELRPVILESAGLVAAIDSYVQRFPPVDLPRVHFKADEINGRLAAVAETTVFNVVQEAINNAKKHARARNIWVTLRQVGLQIIVTIQDDGQGFDVPNQQDAAVKRGSYGLLNMRERTAACDGELNITSARGRGTTVTLTVPVLAVA